MLDKDKKTLDNLIQIEKQRFLGNFSLIFGLFLIYSFIPTKFVPMRFRNYPEDGLSLYQSLGGLKWFLITSIFIGILTFLLWKLSNINTLTKDKLIGELSSIEGEVIEKIANRPLNINELLVREPTGKEVRIKVENIRFRNFTEGQRVKLTYFSNSFFLC